MPQHEKRLRRGHRSSDQSEKGGLTAGKGDDQRKNVSSRCSRNGGTRPGMEALSKIGKELWSPFFGQALNILGKVGRENHEKKKKVGKEKKKKKKKKPRCSEIKPCIGV